MQIAPTTARHAQALRTIFFLGFLLALHTALPTFINSTFLEEFVSEKFVGVVYTVSSLLSVFFFVVTPTLLSRLGSFRFTLGLLVVQFFAVSTLALGTIPVLVIGAFVVSLTTIAGLWFNIDLLLESYSDDAHTGGIRGAYLTITNSAWVVAPVVAGFLLGMDRFPLLYGVTALLLLPIVPIFTNRFRSYRDPRYNRLSFWKTARRLYRTQNLSSVFMVAFLLQFFFSWMVIYTPLYLNQTIGLSFQSIGIIFTVMLLPYVLFQYPLGKLADSKIGEKEILVVGFLIMAGTTALLSFVTTPAVWVWALILFGTRVGGAFVSVMSDTYFFKKTDESDSDVFRFFRMTNPLAYIIGPALASLLLFFTSLQFLFLILGAIVLIGIVFSVRLKDTR